MTAPFHDRGRPPGHHARFHSDRSGASAVEFALVAMPFVLLMLALPQMAIYFMTQSSLDAGVIQTADSLVNTYYAATTPATMTPAALKTLLVSKSGGLVHNDATLNVELRKLSALGATAVAVGNTVDTSAPKDVLVLRAQAFVTSVVPLMGTMSVRSSVIVRRQGL